MPVAQALRPAGPDPCPRERGERVVALSHVGAGPLPVVVVDPTPVQRRFLRTALEGEEFSVVGEARNGVEAIALVERLRPAVVVIDLELHGMSGIEAIERIMATTPTPILAYSSTGPGDDGSTAVEALAAGAVDVIAKPVAGDTGASYALLLRGRVRVASRVRVITHPRGRLRPARTQAPALAERGPSEPAPVQRVAVPRQVPAPATSVASAVDPAARATPRELPTTGPRLIAIGASTGGPQAVLTVLQELPADLAPAVLVVQHMGETFIPGLAAWLDGLLPMPVVVGGNGKRLEPGTVTLAPGGGNLLVRDDRLRVSCVPPDTGQFHVPGIDATFRSVASVLGSAAVGVLLTGMGRDGAAGLLSMRTRGAVTIGQDEATSAVYGMPAAAAALGAVERQLPICEIGAAVVRALHREPV